MSAPSVLYDAPGPRAKRRNLLYTVLFVVAFAALMWWVIGAMDEKGQLDWAKWEPYLAGTEAWTTYLLPGLVNTLKGAGLAILIALPIGALFGIARMSDHWWIARPAGMIVEFFRAVPVLVMMFFANAAYAEFTDIDSDVRPLYAVVTGLVIYNSSVLAEVVRAGILSLPKGQSEAALAVGMRKGQLMTNVLLPQAVTAMLPAIVSQIVVIVKDTTIGGALLGFDELLAQARPAASFYQANTIATLVVIAVVFIVLNYLLTSFANWLERRLRRGKKSTGAVVGGDMVEEQAPGMHLTDESTGHRMN
ncbi:amino acid ABC transporter permease [Actinophytocola gossypii]|uniref:Amino acid ABC transporter permease n=1 Tax=Actinophytocola gossypii TaxID=2812003 RepID=A0ABT2J866_9PSEU|nr:amino acid ABC transporter permease [Actinophytocola gossypii]MCT2584047.1 amino acid ABC transporter permease [Actinophytocola gossypii]